MVRGHFLWGVLLILLFLALVSQLAVWRDLHEEENRLASSDFAPIIQKHKKLRTQINRAKEKQQQLESAILWKHPDRLVPQIAKITNTLSVKLVGLEELSSTYSAGYQSFPRRLTFSGDYAGFAALLAVVEKISPPVRLDGLWVYQRKRSPDTLWLSLILSPMQGENINEVITEIQMPKSSPLVIQRDPFAFGREEITVASLPAKTGNPVVPEIPLPKLTGILWSDRQPMAVFTDGQRRSLLVSENEVVADAKVIEIRPQSVVLMRGKEKHELQLWGEDRGFSVR